MQVCLLQGQLLGLNYSYQAFSVHCTPNRNLLMASDAGRTMAALARTPWSSAHALFADLCTNLVTMVLMAAHIWGFFTTTSGKVSEQRVGSIVGHLVTANSC